MKSAGAVLMEGVKQSKIVQSVKIEFEVRDYVSEGSIDSWMTRFKFSEAVSEIIPTSPRIPQRP